MTSPGGTSCSIFVYFVCDPGASAPDTEGAAVPESRAAEEGGRAAEGGFLPLPVVVAGALPQSQHRNAAAHCRLTHHQLPATHTRFDARSGQFQQRLI